MYARSTGCKACLRLAGAWLLCLALLLPAACALAADDTVAAGISQGLNGEDAAWRECPLGDYAADAVRWATGAQIALIPASLLHGDLVGDGAVTEAEIRELIPSDAAVRICTLTAPRLKELLEESVSRWQLGEKETLDPEASAWDGFLQVSGISVKADASAAPGDRILSVVLDGTALDLGDDAVTVTAAIPDSGFYPGLEGGQADLSLRAMLRDYMAFQGTVELTEQDRIRVIGAHAREIITRFPVWLVGMIAVVIAANAFLTRSRKEETERRPW